MPQYLEGEHVIELVLALVEEATAGHAAKESSTLEDAARVLLLELEELTSSLADLSKDELHAPDLALSAKAVLSEELELLPKRAS